LGKAPGRSVRCYNGSTGPGGQGREEVTSCPAGKGRKKSKRGRWGRGIKVSSLGSREAPSPGPDESRRKKRPYVQLTPCSEKRCPPVCPFDRSARDNVSEKKKDHSGCVNGSYEGEGPDGVRFPRKLEIEPPAARTCLGESSAQSADRAKKKGGRGIPVVRGDQKRKKKRPEKSRGKGRTDREGRGSKGASA